MEAFVTFGIFGWVIGIVLGFIGTNWVFTYRGQQTLHSRISNHGRRLDEYKLEVAKEYVTVEHLKEVETRLLDEIRGLRADLKLRKNA